MKQGVALTIPTCYLTIGFPLAEIVISGNFWSNWDCFFTFLLHLVGLWILFSSKFGRCVLSFLFYTKDNVLQSTHERLSFNGKKFPRNFHPKNYIPPKCVLNISRNRRVPSWIFLRLLTRVLCKNSPPRCSSQCQCVRCPQSLVKNMVAEPRLSKLSAT